MKNFSYFTNFKRQLSLSGENTFSTNKTYPRLISKYYFSKKKTYSSIYKELPYNNILGTYTPHSTHLYASNFLLGMTSQRLSTVTIGYKTSSNVNFTRVSSIVPQQTPFFLSNYSTLKSGSCLQLYKFDNRKSMPIVKKLKRLSYRQYRYVKIFWNKIKSIFSKKHKAKRKKIFFRKKKLIKQSRLVVFNNMFSLYPVNLSTNNFRKSNYNLNPLGLDMDKLVTPVFDYANWRRDIVYPKSILIPNITSLPVTTNNKLSKFSSKSYVFSKHESPFILFSNGVVFPYKFRFKYQLNKSYRTKKLFYSFLRTNELKKSILDSRKKFIYNKTVPLLKSSKIIFKKLTLTSNNILGLLRKNPVLSKSKTGIDVVGRVGSYPDSILPNSGSTTSNELRIPRIRFKPGYQRLWRNFRLAFAESINFKYLYQQQLTKYLMRFYRKLNQTYFDFHENDVKKILVYSRLAPDMYTFEIFFNNKLIFLNGSTLTNKNIQVYSNDFIQLEISNWYYIFSRWLTNTTIKRNSRFKALVFRKSLAGRYKIMKQVKQRSNYTPKWITNTQYDLSDIKTFLEVDFLTLSVFYIYNSSFFLYYTPNDLRIVRYNLFRLYNWKYIT